MTTATAPAATRRTAVEPLFTGRFFMMCAYSFTVFLSAFQLLPTAPFRIVELGGGKLAAGLFVGLLTYASATSAPLTGALADRFGQRRTLIFCSVVIAVFAVGYGFATRYEHLLVLVLLHGVFWSGLLSASSAYATALMPPSRRAEGIGYWGMASTLAVSFAPTIGLWIYQHGWWWLCGSVGVLSLVMGALAASMEADVPAAPGPHGHAHGLVEWPIVAAAFTMFLAAFGHGGIMSFVALYATATGVHPRGLFFLVFALALIAARPFTGRLADQFGHARVLVPCLGLTVLGYGLLAAGGGTKGMVAAAIVHGLGWGSVYPAFAAYIVHHVGDARRGAAFGGILAALDTGIGTGSIVTGWIIERSGYRAAFAVASLVAAFAIPYFLLVAPRALGNPRR